MKSEILKSTEISDLKHQTVPLQSEKTEVKESHLKKLLKLEIENGMLEINLQRSQEDTNRLIKENDRLKETLKTVQNNAGVLTNENDDLRLNLEKEKITMTHLLEQVREALRRNKELAKENQLLRDKGTGDKGTRLSDLHLRNIGRDEEGRVNKTSCWAFFNKQPNSFNKNI